MKAELTFLYVPNDSMGYGRMGVKIHEALVANGVDVFTHHGQEPCPEDRTTKKTNVVCWASVPTHADGWWKSQHAAIFTMWEATVLPESFRENLHNFDTVIVPSDHNVELFSQWHPNVQRVLLGVDPTQWYYRERKPPGMFFDFLIGGSGPRKGLDAAYQAFVKAFPNEPTDGPIPRLTFKSPKGASWGSGESRYQSPNFNHSRVQLVSGKLSSEAEQDLYANAHCYLQPSRGEGFGLQPLQALAQGLPTILTDAHGHESFAHLGYGIGSKLDTAEYFIYGNPPDMQWWEPDIDDLVDQMRFVYDNYDQAAEKARTAARVICRHFTWRNTAESFRGVFGDLLTTPHRESEWRTLDQKKFPMVVKDQRRVANISGTNYVFDPGETYWVTADVKRVLYEAGWLDSGSAEHDPGLTDAQIAATNRDANLFCPTCHQQFGSGLSRDEFELRRSA